ncbi:MAG: BACON domain-containing protein [Bryobacteraceae bacterium]
MIDLPPNSQPIARPLTIFLGRSPFEITQAAQVCDFTPSAGTLSLPASGGRTSLEVPTFCLWDFQTVALPWISVRNFGSNYQMALEANSSENTAAIPRETTVTVVDRPLVIWQAPSGCGYQLIPSRLAIPRGGGEVALYVNTPAGCPWKLQLPQWLQPVGSAQGSGSRSVQLRATAAPAIGRAQPIVLAGVTSDVSQQGSGCPLRVTEVSRKTEGFGSVELAVETPCPWMVRTDKHMVRAISPALGEGPGTVTVEFDNYGNGAASRAWVAIGSELLRFTVPPDTCRPRFNSETASFAGSGEKKDLRIAGLLPFGCPFSPVTDSPWIRVTRGRDWPGSTPEFQVETDPNRTGAPRTGQVKIADQSIVISQAALQVSILRNSLDGQTIAPGSVFSINGTDLGPITSSSGFDTGGTRLFVAGLPAYIVSLTPTSIRAIAPFAMPVTGKVPIRVAAWGLETESLEVAAAATAPRQAGSTVNGSASRVAGYSPFGAGDVITLFLTGAGQTIPASADGEVYSSHPPSLAVTVDASLSDWPIKVLYAGGAPGMIAGVSQINLLIPPDFLPEPPAAQPGAPFVNVWLTIRFDGKGVIYEHLSIKTTAASPNPR